MTCHSCDFNAAVERQFSPAIAARDLRAYRRKGPSATTRLLLDELVEAGVNGGSLLDVGAGIGALTFEMLENGVTSAIAVDASPAYLAAAAQEAARRGRSKVIQFVRSDFLSTAAVIPVATIVALDRVICCYPAYEPLLGEALRHAEQHFAFSYPRDAWHTRAWNAVLNAKRRATGNPFRTFIHPVEQMRQVIARAGFDLVRRRSTWTWTVDVHINRGTR